MNTRLLEGRVAIVTGANQGLGFAIATMYLEQGARLIICARDEARLNSAAATIRADSHSPHELLAVKADVSREEDVRVVVARGIEKFGRIDVLVNNAGIYGPKGSVEEIDWESWRQAIEVNLFGSVLMCREVLRHMRAQGKGKIIQLSGGGATNPLPFLSAYAASKAAVVRFIETLAEEVRDLSIDVNAIAPGALNTRLLDEILAAGPENVGKEFYERAIKQKETGGAGLERGAQLATFLASTHSDGITGKLISAVWDPWSSLPEHLAQLRDTDIYTLRRIVPEDRGMKWTSP